MNHETTTDFNFNANERRATTTDDITIQNYDDDNCQTQQNCSKYVFEFCRPSDFRSVGLFGVYSINVCRLRFVCVIMGHTKKEAREF
jgi:hypothetical protein